MVEQIVALCRELGGEENSLLAPLAHAVQEDLRRRLKSGLTPEDCGGVFPLCAAMIVLDRLEEVTGESRVTSFTAGEVSIRRERSGDLSRQAMGLLAPWLGDTGFGFQGVEG